MPPSNDPRAIKITLEDLQKVATPETVPTPVPPPATGSKSYGSVTDAADKLPLTADEKGSMLLEGWFYLGLAGLGGALLGWAIAEPAFIDGGGHSWGNWVITPLIVTLICVGFGLAESIVERSARKAAIRGSLALPLGAVLGFIFYGIANVIYAIGMALSSGAGAQTIHNPAFWIARGFAWMVFGAAAGIVYGIIGLSGRKTLYGVLGGVLGAGLGGVLFDPIAMLTHGGAPSRAVGFGLVGLSTGVAVGLVESALKDRWLYVTSGPLSGKQFILYKPRTVIGSHQQSDIYLFKDATILAQHAVVEISGTRVQVRAVGETYVSGQPVRLQVLLSGSTLQIGRYAFRYQERQRK